MTLRYNKENNGTLSMEIVATGLEREYPDHNIVKAYEHLYEVYFDMMDAIDYTFNPNYEDE